MVLINFTNREIHDHCDCVTISKYVNVIVHYFIINKWLYVNIQWFMVTFKNITNKHVKKLCKIIMIDHHLVEIVYWMLVTIIMLF